MLASQGAIVRNAKTVVQQQRCSAPPRGRQRYYSGVAHLAVPLLVEHSHISDLEGQRLVSVILSWDHVVIATLRAKGYFFSLCYT
jgi:hypothetical protein